MKVIAIIPIKHHSSRIPGKNYRLMNGKPLCYHILNTLVSLGNKIDKIIVDTDSDTIKEIIGNEPKFDNIIIYNRPEKLRDSEMSTNVLLLNVITDLNLDADMYLHTHCTNPLLEANTINKCIYFMIENNAKYDSLFTVNKMHTRLYNCDFTPMNHNPQKLIPTQNLDPIYEENSCLYLVKKDALLKYKRRIGIKPYLFSISKLESQDIDWEEDFILTEIIMKHFEK